jgi:hypothetical protein
MLSIMHCIILLSVMGRFALSFSAAFAATATFPFVLEKVWLWHRLMWALRRRVLAKTLRTLMHRVPSG